MKEQNLSKAEMAKRIYTSRSQLDRLLDPDKTSVAAGTLAKAARVVERSLKMELVQDSENAPNSASTTQAG